MLQPRPYQLECVDAVFGKLAEHDSTIAVMATGSGKTPVAGLICSKWDRPGRVLFLAHKEELVNQGAKHMRLACPDDQVEIEMAGYYATPASHFQGDLMGRECPRIVVASKDSLCQPNRLSRFAEDEFSLLIVDENHHAIPKNRSYSDILSHFSSAKRVGFTATADRADGEALGQLFESVAYVYDISDAIDDGWLVPIVQQFVMVTDYDLSEVHDAINRATGERDLKISEVEEVMRREKVLHGVADAMIKYSNHDGQRRPALIFAASVEHAHLLAEIINRHHAKDGTGMAVALDGKTDREIRSGSVDAFKGGEFQYLCNCALFGEGVDLPGVRIVGIALPTKSRSRYSQQVGRVTRPHESIVDALNNASSSEERKQIIRNSQKPAGMVIDFVGNSGRHKLVTAADILGGIYPQEVVDRANANIRNKPKGRGDVQAELEEAQRQLTEEEKKREAERRKHIIVRAEFTAVDVDPFELLDVRPTREPPWLRGKQATGPQRALLEKHGVPVPKDLSLHDAKALLDVVIKKRDAGPPSPKMARLLHRYGYNPREHTFKEACEIIDGLKQNNWQKV